MSRRAFLKRRIREGGAPSSSSRSRIGVVVHSFAWRSCSLCLGPRPLVAQSPAIKKACYPICEGLALLLNGACLLSEAVVILLKQARAVEPREGVKEPDSLLPRIRLLAISSASGTLLRLRAPRSPLARGVGASCHRREHIIERGRQALPDDAGLVLPCWVFEGIVHEVAFGGSEGPATCCLIAPAISVLGPRRCGAAHASLWSR